MSLKEHRRLLDILEARAPHDPAAARLLIVHKRRYRQIALRMAMDLLGRAAFSRMSIEQTIWTRQKCAQAMGLRYEYLF